MKINKIQQIKKYKSFKDFSWHRFFNTDTFHEKVNLLYGENGSGKSSICNVLKSVSQSKDFERYFPGEAELLIDDTVYKYSNRNWDGNITKDNILFFDRPFVERNVHLGHDRGTQQGEQEQESGKLIIEFDGEAINLRSARTQLEAEKDKRNKEVEDYQKANRSILDFELPGDEESLFQKYKDKDSQATKKDKGTLENNRADLDQKVKSDSDLQKNAIEIQNINELEGSNVYISFSTDTDYQALFNFDLKEKAKIEAKEELVNKIKSHKEFFEIGLEIRHDHPGQCPFCQTKNEETSIGEIVDAYNKIYDDTYKTQQVLFSNNKQTLIDELDKIKGATRDFNLDDIFIKLKKVSEKYRIKDVYSVDEEELLKKPRRIKKIDDLRKKISELQKPTKEDISILYKEAEEEFDILAKFFGDISEFIKKKNQLIRDFKKEHTDAKLTERIGKNSISLASVVKEFDFLQTKKIDSQKAKLEKKKELQKITDALEKAKTDHKTAKDAYEKYCSTEAFKKILQKIETYFDRFNFTFKLQADGTRNTGLTKELPFAFKVVDSDGNERDLKEGLSEGEMQVLSICFFFAFLDIQDNKDSKVLVFDDPITSLDDSNLSSLVDLIAEEQEKFSQSFIFTHHRTFLKFLRKKFKNDESRIKSKEYNILRNKSNFGGSFICKSKEERFVEKLKEFESHLSQISQNQNGFDVELKIIEYGQYLRYETEHLIKCKILHWDQAHEFGKVVDGIKNNRNLEDKDLDEIKKIYSFCNWTTSHVDVGDDHGLTQLKSRISAFTTIYDKV